jgi:hypothetical protein
LLWAQLFANFGSLRHPTFSDTSDTYTTAMVMHQYVAASLGLLSLAAIAGAGVGVGSGVGMMAMAMAEEEAKQGGAAVAHSVKEPRQSMTRGLAASAVSKQ